MIFYHSLAFAEPFEEDTALNRLDVLTVLVSSEFGNYYITMMLQHQQ